MDRRQILEILNIDQLGHPDQGELFKSIESGPVFELWVLEVSPCIALYVSRIYMTNVFCCGTIRSVVCAMVYRLNVCGVE